MLGMYLVAAALLGGAVLLHVLVRRTPLGRASTIRLTGSAALHVVEVDGRRLLVSTGPGSAPRLVAELSPAVPALGPSPAESGRVGPSTDESGSSRPPMQEARARHGGRTASRRGAQAPVAREVSVEESCHAHGGGRRG